MKAIYLERFYSLILTILCDIKTLRPSTYFPVLADIVITNLDLVGSQKALLSPFLNLRNILMPILNHRLIDTNFFLTLFIGEIIIIELICIASFFDEYI